MSVDINWEALTGGPDGAALADTIRDFIHERFQSIPLPKLIRSVTVHNFEFGKTPPEITLKDIGNPLPDFYENEDDDTPEDNEEDPGDTPELRQAPIRHGRAANGSRRQSEIDIMSGTANLARGTTPGVLGTASNLGYFQLSAGLPGAQTPLAAMAGGHFGGGAQPMHAQHHHAESFSSTSPPSTATPASSQEHTHVDRSLSSAGVDEVDMLQQNRKQQPSEACPEDLQVVFHATYSGDLRLSLTADVFLDYPMPSFVGIPLKLRITGLTFNGVGILAYIKKRAHLCFLNPEDAEALIGGESTFEDSHETNADAEDSWRPSKVGTLLEDIKIESEMGETESGKQVLKNVGKIEKFILEQVQRIFEDEFVYPSFWTFLV